MTGPSEATPRLRTVWVGRTVVGQVRANNEDNLWASTIPTSGSGGGDTDGDAPLAWAGVLLAVADGMGGALAGEVASKLAVHTVAAEMDRAIETSSETGGAESHRSALVGAVETANHQIRVEGESNPQQRGMGTTLTALWLHGGVADVAQVGDSRAYCFRGGHLRQLTKDQSLVGKLIEDGIITEDEAERIAGKNIILQALGSEEELEVAHQVEALEAGDLLLLCTDGLSGVVNNTDLQDEMRKGGTPAEHVKRLIDLAEARGGPDNITVLIAELEKA